MNATGKEKFFTLWI